MAREALRGRNEVPLGPNDHRGEEVVRVCEIRARYCPRVKHIFDQFRHMARGAESGRLYPKAIQTLLTTLHAPKARLSCLSVISFFISFSVNVKTVFKESLEAKKETL